MPRGQRKIKPDYERLFDELIGHLAADVQQATIKNFLESMVESGVLEHEQAISLAVDHDLAMAIGLPDHCFVKHTAPVWIELVDGEPVRVVVEDDKLSPEPIGIVNERSATFTDDDVRPITDAEREAYSQTRRHFDLPGWEWGW